MARVKGIIEEQHKMRPMSLLLLSCALVLSSMIIHNAFTNQKAKRIATASLQSGPTTPATVVLKYDPIIESTQKELAQLGLYTGALDGVIGSKTKEAIQQYQAQNGLTANGEPSQDLLNHIRFMRKVQAASQVTGSISKVDVDAAIAPAQDQIAPVVSAEKSSLPKQTQIKPSRNLTLKKVQVQLASLGYDIATFEGEMNSKTRGAILKFQMDRNLEMSGRVDATLLKALKLR